MIYINDVRRDKIDSAFDEYIWNNMYVRIEYEKQSGLFDGIYYNITSTVDGSV